MTFFQQEGQSSISCDLIFSHWSPSTKFVLSKKVGRGIVMQLVNLKTNKYIFLPAADDQQQIRKSSNPEILHTKHKISYNLKFFITQFDQDFENNTSALSRQFTDVFFSKKWLPKHLFYQFCANM